MTMYITKLQKIGIDTFKQAKSEGGSNELAILKVRNLVKSEVPNIPFELRPISNATHLTNKIDNNERWSDYFLQQYILGVIFGYFIREKSLSISDFKTQIR